MDVTIRPVRPTDAADLHNIRTCPRVQEMLLHTPSLTLDQIAREIEKTGPEDQRLVAEVTVPDGSTRVVGEVTLSVNQRRRRHSGSLDMAVHDDFQGHGIGKKLLAAALDLADNWLGLLRIEFAAFVDNNRGIPIYERAGFVREGLLRNGALRQGELVDVVQMARLHPVLAPAIAAVAAPAGSQQGQEKRSKRRITPQIQIRPPRIGDLRDLHELRSQPSVVWGSHLFPGLTQAAVKQWLDRVLQGHPYHTLVAEATTPGGDTKVVGQASLMVRSGRLNHSAGLTMAVLEGYQGLGIGDQLLSALLDLADNHLGLRRIDLEVYTDNTRGVALYGKHGFEVEGVRRLFAFRDGRYADALLMGRIR
jgi:putative acetyltransferase